ncbi:MAG: response regulator, partial [Hyphomicrobiales bacterium]|nr:response regulator [Hyphomicrobiales bacterium]
MPATIALHAAIDPSFAFVIDDDAELRRFVTATLKQLGMRVADFEMAKDALASLDSVHPAVIFLDVALLRSDAIDVLRGLGERRYAGRVQLMSGARPSLLQAVQRIGVSIKPTIRKLRMVFKIIFSKPKATSNGWNGYSNLSAKRRRAW